LPYPELAQALPSPFADVPPYGCDPSVDPTPEERAILDEAAERYGAYLSQQGNNCQNQYMPVIAQGSGTCNQAMMDEGALGLKACTSSAGATHFPALEELRDDFDALCRQQSGPIEYPRYSHRSLPPSVLVGIGNGCDPMTSPTAQEQSYLDEIEALEAGRRADYGDCLNNGRALIQNAMNSRASVDEVVALQNALITCVNDVLDSYAQEIEGAVADLEAHCSSLGQPVDVVIEDSPDVIVEEGESPPAGQRAGMSTKGYMAIGGLLLLAIGGTYMMTRRR
jgi:hypothetical protein